MSRFGTLVIVIGIVLSTAGQVTATVSTLSVARAPAYSAQATSVQAAADIRGTIPMDAGITQATSMQAAADVRGTIPMDTIPMDTIPMD